MKITLIWSEYCVKCRQLESFLPWFCTEHLFEYEHIDANDYEWEVASVPTIIVDWWEHSWIYSWDEFLAIINNLWK